MKPINVAAAELLNDLHREDPHAAKAIADLQVGVNKSARKFLELPEGEAGIRFTDLVNKVAERMGEGDGAATGRLTSVIDGPVHQRELREFSDGAEAAAE